MNTAEFLASLESWAAIGLDELNYDSFWDHSATQDMEDDEAEEQVAKEEVVEVTEASTKVPRWPLCYACFNLNVFKICIV